MFLKRESHEGMILEEEKKSGCEGKILSMFLEMTRIFTNFRKHTANKNIFFCPKYLGFCWFLIVNDFKHRKESSIGLLTVYWLTGSQSINYT